MIDQNSSIEIYSTRNCGYCRAAKHLLDLRGLKYTEYDVTVNAEKREEMMHRSNRRTVPQIFINDESIGGYQELVQLLAGQKE
jgi:GrxC family glutaredoxin